MTQFSPNTLSASRRPSGPNIYTFLLLSAFLALVVACVFVLMRYHELFGQWNPFAPVAAASSHLPGFASLASLLC